MPDRDHILEHAARQQRYEQSRRVVPNDIINPADAGQVEDLIDDIEMFGDFAEEIPRSRAAQFLRLFHFCEEAINAILAAEASREQRVHCAYLEAVRLQIHRTTEGVPEKPPLYSDCEMKTVVFGNTPPTPEDLEKPPDASPSVLVESSVSDGEYEEVEVQIVNEVPTTAKTITPDQQAEVISQPHPLTAPLTLALPAPATTKKRKAKANFPADVVPLVNAHPGSDRAATLYQTHLVKWVPEIKTLPQYAVLELFGELNGQLVDLTLYVNRLGLSCYCGNEFKLTSGGCHVRWDTEILGPLPARGSFIPLRIVSVNLREVRS